MLINISVSSCSVSFTVLILEHLPKQGHLYSKCISSINCLKNFPLVHCGFSNSYNISYMDFFKFYICNVNMKHGLQAYNYSERKIKLFQHSRFLKIWRFTLCFYKFYFPFNINCGRHHFLFSNIYTLSLLSSQNF